MADAKNAPLKISDPAIPTGSLVVVTGVNGYIGSHVADQLLAADYKVRGVVRSVSKTKWLKDLFATYGSENFELFEVSDMAVAGAYDEAIKGAAGFVHVASPLSWDPDPHKVVPIAVDATVNALKSAFKEPSLKRFVLTSSSTAAYSPHLAQNKELIVKADTWNEFAVEKAWAPPPYTPDRSFITYSASKTEGEQALWKFYAEHKAERPDIVINSVLPNANFGLLLDAKNQGFPSTAGFQKSLFEGDKEAHDEVLVPQFYVDVQDDARLHAAALLLPDVKEERVFAFADVFNINDELDAWRKVRPNKKFLDNDPNAQVHKAKVPNDRAEELLRKVGRERWTSLEESFALMVPAYEA